MDTSPNPFPFNNQQSMTTEIAHPITFSDQKGVETKPQSLKPNLISEPPTIKVSGASSI